jgi:hypothetical protein
VQDGERSLELTGASVARQQQAVEAFVRSMTAEPPRPKIEMPAPAPDHRPDHRDAEDLG